MAVRGLKPVVEIQFFDYIWPAMMQIRDELSMLRVPIQQRLVLSGRDSRADRRIPQGRRPLPQPVRREHLRALPRPAHRVSVDRRRRGGVCFAPRLRSDDPVLFLEHKHLYRQTYNKGIYPGPDYTLPFARGAVRREGRDVTVVTWGALVQRSLLAAERADQEGIDVRIVDLRTIAPLRLGEPSPPRGAGDQPGRDCARRPVDVRFRRGARGADSR